MAHSPTSYMDGVPVKISEKYKPPPKISLPQKIVHCLAHCAAAATNVNTPDQYDFHLERHTQVSMSSWKNVRQQERFARKERIRQRTVERQRQLDEQQKQMLTAVSYPSAEDLSSDEEDQDISPEELPPTVAAETRTLDSEVGASAAASASVMQTLETQLRFDTILKPTIMAGHPRPESYWSFSDQLANVASNNLSAEIASRYTSSSALAQINYSDFEDDTSSPFDNVELKTIDDLDILAQVLKQNYVSTKGDTTATELAAEEVNIAQSSTDSSTINQNHTESIQIAETNNPPSSSTTEVSISHPVNENVLNSNGEGHSKPQPIIANHSSGYYTSSSPIPYARNYDYYDNQNHHHHHHHLAYSMSPDQKHVLHAPAVQQVYFNYPNSTTHVDHNQPVNTHPSCNHMYATTYGVHVPQYSSHIGPDPTGASDTRHANSVPDILRQLKTSSSGNALH